MRELDALGPVELDAVARPAVAHRPPHHPDLGGHRITDLSALAGCLVWTVATAVAIAGPLALSTVELFVALAVLVVVPLGVGLAATPRESGDGTVLYSLAVAGQFPAALLAVVSLALPVGSLAGVALVMPWLCVAGLVALFGLWRLLSRGLWPLPELAVDAALLYLPVGAVALALHRAGISLLFDPLIILLTVVHYHYAGLALPLIAGLAGRRIAGEDGRFGATLAGRVATVATLVIVVNLALIAVGITFSPLVELLAVSGFTVAVACFAALVLWRVVPSVGVVPGALLAVAALSLFLTMALALAYGYSAFPRTGVLVTIDQMIRWHGSVNAVGFVLPALLAFRLVDR